MLRGGRESDPIGISRGVTLFSHRWGVAAVALMLPVSLGRGGATVYRRRIRSTRHSAGVLLDTFGKWQVKGLLDNTYLLIGESAGDGEGHFWLHCDQNNLMTVAVPLAERNGQERLRSHAVTVRADTGATRAMSLVVFESFVAVAMDYDGGRNDKVTDFINVLRAAKETVTISYAHKTYQYDVTELPAAQARFQQLCSRSSARQ